MIITKDDIKLDFELNDENNKIKRNKKLKLNSFKELEIFNSFF